MFVRPVADGLIQTITVVVQRTLPRFVFSTLLLGYVRKYFFMRFRLRLIIYCVSLDLTND